MRYVTPLDVTSPKDAVSNIRLILDQGAEGISVAQIDWYEEPILVMRWNVSLREWDDPEKISEENICLGMPVSRGYPVWFVIPEDFLDRNSELWKNIKIGLEQLNKTK